MSIKLHILNSTGVFDDHEKMIKDTFDWSIRFISKLLEVGCVDIVVQHTEHVIPETGMAGYSPAENRLFISIDPFNENLAKNFKTEFLATLGHELHHCQRHKTPGYGSTLKEALVSEGLACHFETELRGGLVPFYATSLSKKVREELLEKMRPEFDNETYNHGTWFFGSERLTIPKYSGYSVGFALVDRYIVKNRIPASQLWSKSATEILS